MRVSFHTYPELWPFPVSWRRGSPRYYRFEHGDALRTGMKRHGVTTLRAGRDRFVDSDLAVIWSWKQPRLIEQMLSSGRHVLVMERGFLPDRRKWCSLALDGFNGRGRFAPARDAGERWQDHFAHLLKPWKPTGGRHALLIGKGERDVSLHGADFKAWAADQTAKLLSEGYTVRYRGHPDRPTQAPPGAEMSPSAALSDDLEWASVVVSFNSSTDVEAVLAGVPSIITDIGSLAYPMASHAVTDPLVTPDRSEWGRQMAWRQWTIEELRNGDAWDHMRQLLG